MSIVNIPTRWGGVNVGIPGIRCYCPHLLSGAASSGSFGSFSCLRMEAGVWAFKIPDKFSEHCSSSPTKSGHLLPTRCLLLQGFPNKKKVATNSQHSVFFVDFFYCCWLGENSVVEHEAKPCEVCVWQNMLQGLSSRGGGGYWLTTTNPSCQQLSKIPATHCGFLPSTGALFTLGFANRSSQFLSFSLSPISRLI